MEWTETIMNPSRHKNPDPAWIEPSLPDFQLIQRLARQVGYSVAIHGSLKRDVDLVAAPWTDESVGNATLVDHLCEGLDAKRVGGPEYKPHGRVAVTLQIDGYYKIIDLSIMPTIGKED
jgi:hypothetical protein